MNDFYERPTPSTQPGGAGWIDDEPAVYECPYCYKTMPSGYEPAMWSCCGEIGHAVRM